jgi:murein DD-endopeptidase MepM/ murein hydrolase activator NlpD
MSIFPLKQRPSASYHQAPRSFGCLRDNGHRTHAACDLYAPANSEVLAVEDGVVVAGPYLFYDIVMAIEVKHASGIIVRYGEISGVRSGLRAGTLVKAGSVIAYVGRMQSVSQSMLHFELYSGQATGPLTDVNRGPYKRRPDLVNPTSYLDGCICLADLPPSPAAEPAAV